jgi:zinc-binding alcohol dehydrogenase family protein
MKAVVVNRLARPELSDIPLLIDSELPDPEVKPNDLLVRVEAVAVNPIDLKMARAKQPPQGPERVLGWDVAGTVVGMGAEASGFQLGDAVFYAGSVLRPGACSALHAVDARLVGHKPSALSFVQAAALPLSSLAAWEALFERMRLPRGSLQQPATLLVIGGAGGVGSMALQLASTLTELRVVGTASRPESQLFCREMGAADVVDHSQPLLPQLKALGVPLVNFVLCLTDPAPLMPQLADILAPHAHFCSLVEASADLPMNLLRAKSITFSWEGMFTRSMFKTADMARQGEILNEVSALVDKGVLKTTLRVDLGNINVKNVLQAHQLIGSGRMIGKVAMGKFD